MLGNMETMTPRSRRKIIVIKLTGGLFNKNEPRKIKNFSNILNSYHSNNKNKLQIILVIGGGKNAQVYISTAKKLGADQASLDEIGIEISRIHARLFIAALGDNAYPYPPLTLLEAVKAAETGKIVAIGGFQPGQSTNAVAALVAERLKASLFINATEVGGVYNKDPTKYPKATMLTKVTVTELGKILGKSKTDAGTYDLMDPLALKVIARSKIPTKIIRCNSKELRMALDGKIVGTLVGS